MKKIFVALIFLSLSAIYSCKKAVIGSLVGKFRCRHDYSLTLSAPPYTDTTYTVGYDTLYIVQANTNALALMGTSREFYMADGDPTRWVCSSGGPPYDVIQFYDSNDSIVFMDPYRSSPARWEENDWYGIRF